MSVLAAEMSCQKYETASLVSWGEKSPSDGDGSVRLISFGAKYLSTDASVDQTGDRSRKDALEQKVCAKQELERAQGSHKVMRVSAPKFHKLFRKKKSRQSYELAHPKINEPVSLIASGGLQTS